MRLTAHPQAILKAVALTAAAMAGVPSQAALTTLTLDSGLQVSQDAATGLLWRSFDDANVGVQAGFRQATAADFDALLTNNGYSATGRLPSDLAQLGTAPIVITPEVTQTTATEKFYTLDGSAVPQEFLDQQAAYKANYLAALQNPNGRSPATIERTYTTLMATLKDEYGVSSQIVTETKVITPAVILTPPAINTGGVSASYYASNGLSAMSVAGAHSYDNNVSFGEAHFFIMGQVQADDGFWVGATVDDFVARQCGPGDPGYYGYETVSRYCGGTSSTYGYLGPSAYTEFQANRFNHVDNISVNNKPMGYLMVQSVPEPSTYALMGLGLVGLAWVRACQRQAA